MNTARTEISAIAPGRRHGRFLVKRDQESDVIYFVLFGLVKVLVAITDHLVFVYTDKVSRGI
jgi:hypothetical protein